MIKYEKFSLKHYIANRMPKIKFYFKTHFLYRIECLFFFLSAVVHRVNTHTHTQWYTVTSKTGFMIDMKIAWNILYLNLQKTYADNNEM